MSKTLRSSGKVTLVAVNKSGSVRIREYFFTVRERVIKHNTTPSPNTHTYKQTESKPEQQEVGLAKGEQENVSTLEHSHLVRICDHLMSPQAALTVSSVVFTS